MKSTGCTPFADEPEKVFAGGVPTMENSFHSGPTIPKRFSKTERDSPAVFRCSLQGGLKGGTAIRGPPERGLRVAAGIRLGANPLQVTEMEEAQRIPFCLPFFRISLSPFGDNIDHEDILLADETASSY
ncbi:MAG: hypothetical protein HPY84_13570 [Syntrophobacteraceae bacterium]|nr:hypothetical protein [Syntrophobacteraceae bacterium]